MTRATPDELKRAVDQLVLRQANVFLLEWVRHGLGIKGVTPNKGAIGKALHAAIDDGVLTGDKLDTWLRDIEGWGNQHVYAFALPDDLASAAVWGSEARVGAAVEKAFPGTWRAPTSDSFPDEAQLTRVDYDTGAGVFVMEWYKRTDSRVRSPAMDRWVAAALAEAGLARKATVTSIDESDNAVEVDGDIYWFAAQRLLAARSVMRFAIVPQPRAGGRPLAALFVRPAVATRAHRDAVGRAWNDLGELRLGGTSLGVIRDTPWSISRVIKRLDNAVVRNKETGFGSVKTQFAEGEATVEFKAPPDMTLPDIIAGVRLSIPQNAIDSDDFVGSTGEFRMARDEQRARSRQARLELFQADNRIRIWAELDQEGVWAILQILDRYR